MKLELSCDDGCVLDMKLADLLAKHNLKATFYIPVMWESYNNFKGWQPLSRGQIIELADNFEIGSHTITHPLLTRIPYGAAEYEIVESKSMLEDLFQKPITKFAYPRGYATDQLRDIVRKHYDFGRSTLVGHTEPPEDTTWVHNSVHLACDRREYNTQNWFDYGIRHLKLASKNGYFGAFMHSWEIEKNQAWQTVDRFLEAVKYAS